MPLLSAEDRQFLIDHFQSTLENPVKLVFFTQTIACQFCRETGEILSEVAELSDKITLETYNFVTDKEVAEQYGVDKIPATVVMGDVDYGIRFYGIPSGYEFTSLIEDIIDVSRGKTELSEETLEVLESIEEPVHMQVFVTPTCPYCPSAVRMAHSFAIASDKVRADMVEAIEFPHLSNKYHVHGVPRTVIRAESRDEDAHLEGAGPEFLVLAKVKQALGLISAEEIDRMLEEITTQVQAMDEGGEEA
jgi:glutaredoxin-like protein